MSVTQHTQQNFNVMKLNSAEQRLEKGNYYIVSYCEQNNSPATFYK